MSSSKTKKEGNKPRRLPENMNFETGSLATQDDYIRRDIITYLEDVVNYQEYFPTYEQLYYDSKEAVGLVESQYRDYVEQLIAEKDILQIQIDEEVKRLYPAPKTSALAIKIAKIILGYSRE